MSFPEELPSYHIINSGQRGVRQTYSAERDYRVLSPRVSRMAEEEFRRSFNTVWPSSVNDRRRETHSSGLRGRGDTPSRSDFANQETRNRIRNMDLES